MLEQPDFGRRVRQLRQESGLTARQLAGRGGLSQAHLSRIETGVRNPTPAVVQRLVHGLQVEVSAFDVLAPEPDEPPVDLVEVARLLGVAPRWREGFAAATLALAAAWQADQAEPSS